MAKKRTKRRARPAKAAKGKALRSKPRARKTTSKRRQARKVTKKRSAPKKLASKRARPSPGKKAILRWKRRAPRNIDLAAPAGKFADIVARIAEGRPEEILAEGAKFNIGVSHNAEAIPALDVPPEYGKDSLSLLVVDPRLVFTYWEVRQETMMEAARRAGGFARLTLRFYDITATGDPDSSPSWDVEVFDRLGNWYLRLEKPQQRLCLDIGMKGASGAFHRIARSNVMRLPPASLARPGPIKWMVATPAGDKLISDVEEYTDADLALLKKILGPYFFDLLMRGRFASIAGSSMEALFYDIQALRSGESPAGKPAWLNP